MSLMASWSARSGSSSGTSGVSSVTASKSDGAERFAAEGLRCAAEDGLVAAAPPGRFLAGDAAWFEELGDRGLLGLPVGGALSSTTASLARRRLLHLQRGAEGLVTVVGVQERRLIRIVTRGAGWPEAGTDPPEQTPGQGVTGVGGRSAPSSGQGPALGQQVADLGDGLAGQNQGGERGQENEQDDGSYRGEQRRQRVTHQPSQESAGVLQTGDVVPEDRVSTADLDHSGQSGQQAQAPD